MDDLFFDQTPSVFDQFELLVFNLLFVTVDAVRAGSYLLAPAVGLGSNSCGLSAFLISLSSIFTQFGNISDPILKVGLSNLLQILGVQTSLILLLTGCRKVEFE